MAKKIDKILQKDILAILVKDISSVYKLKRIIDADYFSTRSYRYLYNGIIDHAEKHNESISKKLLLLKLSKIKDDDKRSEFRKKLLPIYKRKVDSETGIINEVKEWAEKQKFGQIIERAANAGFDGDVTKGKEILKSSFLFDSKDSDFIVHNALNEWKERQSERKAEADLGEKKVIPTGLGVIDDYARVYKKMPMLGLLMGTSGVGKSISVINIGSHAIAKNCNVAHFVFENTAKQTLARYDSKLTKYPYTYIRDFEWNKQNLKLANRIMKGLRKKKGNRLKVIHAPIDTVSVSDIEGLLREIEITENWVPDLLIYDSLDHMISSESQESFRLSVKKTFTDAKRQSEIRRIPIWSSTHAKASARNTRVRQESFSESYDKVRLADGVLTISQTQEQEDDRQAEIWIDKWRDGPGNVGILVDLLFRVMSLRFIEPIIVRGE